MQEPAAALVAEQDLQPRFVQGAYANTPNTMPAEVCCQVGLELQGRGTLSELGLSGHQSEREEVV